jgi:BUD22
LDHERVANSALKAKLIKDKTLSGNSDVQSAIASELVNNLLEPANPSTQEAKVQSRLLSSKRIALQVTRAVDDLRKLLQSNQTVSLLDKMEDDDDIDNDIEEHPSKSRRVASNNRAKLDTDEATGAQLTGDELGWESGDVDDGESIISIFQFFDLYLVESSGSTAGSKVEESDDVDDSDEPRPHASTSGRVTNSKSGITDPRSTFLPSLAVGFTRGESDDSEWSETENPAEESSIKKNRRGQRARRA